MRTEQMFQKQNRSTTGNQTESGNKLTTKFKSQWMATMKTQSWRDKDSTKLQRTTRGGKLLKI